MSPTIFGYPFWFGKIKKRVAKKYMNRWSISWFYKNRDKFAGYAIGSIINDCSGLNGKILDIQPYYNKKAGGYVLADIDFQTTNTGCSLIHCGIEPKLSREEIEKRTLDHLRVWLSPGGPGDRWYGGLDNPEYQDEIKRQKHKLSVLESGGHFVDEDGLLLPEFNRNNEDVSPV